MKTNRKPTSASTRSAAPISFRPKPEARRQLSAIEEALGVNSTEAILRAIAKLYEEVVRTKGTPYEAFEKAGLIGCAEGPPDLSSNYKQVLSELISRKV